MPVIRWPTQPRKRRRKLSGLEYGDRRYQGTDTMLGTDVGQAGVRRSRRGAASAY